MGQGSYSTMQREIGDLRDLPVTEQYRGLLRALLPVRGTESPFATVREYAARFSTFKGQMESCFPEARNVQEALWVHLFLEGLGPKFHVFEMNLLANRCLFDEATDGGRTRQRIGLHEVVELAYAEETKQRLPPRKPEMVRPQPPPIPAAPAQSMRAPPPRSPQQPRSRLPPQPLSSRYARRLSTPPARADRTVVPSEARTARRDRLKRGLLNRTERPDEKSTSHQTLFSYDRLPDTASIAASPARLDLSARFEVLRSKTEVPPRAAEEPQSKTEVPQPRMLQPMLPWAVIPPLVKTPYKATLSLVNSASKRQNISVDPRLGPGPTPNGRGAASGNAAPPVVPRAEVIIKSERQPPVIA